MARRSRARPRRLLQIRAGEGRRCQRSGRPYRTRSRRALAPLHAGQQKFRAAGSSAKSAPGSRSSRRGGPTFQKAAPWPMRRRSTARSTSLAAGRSASARSPRSRSSAPTTTICMAARSDSSARSSASNTAAASAKSLGGSATNTGNGAAAAPRGTGTATDSRPRCARNRVRARRSQRHRLGRVRQNEQHQSNGAGRKRYDRCLRISLLQACDAKLDGRAGEARLNGDSRGCVGSLAQKGAGCLAPDISAYADRTSEFRGDS